MALLQKIGFFVNPVAGMGGAVGLKGTDGVVNEAKKLGAQPVAPKRALRFLRALGDNHGLSIFTCGGSMGEDELKEAGYTGFSVLSTPQKISDATDTIDVCRSFLAAEIDVIVFCGGDGTARDVVSVTSDALPVLGIPAGVKMYSGIFALSPEKGAEILQHATEIAETEVLDIDEKSYRLGTLSTSLYGVARTPVLGTYRQAGKCSFFGDDERSRQEIARFLTEILRDDTLYILGAGSTTAAVSSHLSVPSTLLGIDAVYQGECVGQDLNEQGLLELLRTYPKAKIILSPIGAQGFVLGRGNQQISPAVLEKVGPENLIVVATPQKLAGTPTLYLDPGNPDLALHFGENIQVITGYAMARRMPLVLA